MRHASGGMAVTESRAGGRIEEHCGTKPRATKSDHSANIVLPRMERSMTGVKGDADACRTAPAGLPGEAPRVAQSGGTEPDAVDCLRQELGRRLSTARKAAGYSQAGLARVTGFSRSAVSNAEIGHPHVGRVFWERCQLALGGRHMFVAGFDQIRHRKAAEAEAAAFGRVPPAPPPLHMPGPPGQGLPQRNVADAGRIYRQLGWPAHTAGGRLELETGNVLDALEVPRAAGMLAVRWWLYTQGVPDDIRGVPGLPPPNQALAVVAAGRRWLFLVQAGACPWTSQDLAAPRAGPDAMMRWHSRGSRIPAPPSPDADGQLTEWAQPPPRVLQLADPVALLDLLVKAAFAVRRNHMLTFAGGITVGPAGSSAP